MTSKLAEKEYLDRTGGRVWEREKPFSPPGTDTFDESLRLLHDFAAAATLLQPGASDRILDLGAGGGWCSDLLQRLNRKTVAVDISLSMLQVTRERPLANRIQAVAGDFERLPFVDGSFDRAICLNALHHVPDMRAAVREIARILSPNGVAVFSEPGIGHAAMPASVSAHRDFGVLEQEVLIEPFIEMCHDAGFPHARVVPMTYIIPGFHLSLDDWRSWQQLERTRRPVRAFRRLWLALLEIFGLGKRSVLFEEAFAMRLVRLLQVPVAEHPFFLVAKGETLPPNPDTYQAAIVVDEMPGRSAPGARVTARVRIRNTGTAIWPAASETGTGQVRLGVQLLDAAGKVLNRDFARVPLDTTVGVRESAALTGSFNAPAQTGSFLLKFDLVCEGRAWFETGGSQVATRPLDVQ